MQIIVSGVMWLLFILVTAATTVRAAPDQSRMKMTTINETAARLGKRGQRLQTERDETKYDRRIMQSALLPLSRSEKRAMCKSCYLSVFLHIAKTGGSFDFEDVGFSPTRSILIMNLAHLAREVLSVPSPELAENRRLSIVIHGQVHHDGCLTHNLTLPWVLRVSDAYRTAGCNVLVWTFLREPVSHFISAFRWYNLGFRQIDMRIVAEKWQMLGSTLKPWALRTLKVHRLDNEDETYMNQIDNFMATKIMSVYLFDNNHHLQKILMQTNESASYDTTRASSLLHSNLTTTEKQMLMLLYLADGDDKRMRRWTAETAFQSIRLLPLNNPLINHVHIEDSLQDSSAELRYRPESYCGNKTSWTQLISTSRSAMKSRNHVDISLPSSLSIFDFIGLTELHGVALMQVARILGCPIDGIIKASCSYNPNPARDKTLDPGAWYPDRLPSITQKLMRILLADEIRFYNTVREQHWCRSSNLTAVIHHYAALCPKELSSSDNFLQNFVSNNGFFSKVKKNGFS